MISLETFIAFLLSIPVCASVIYYTATYIKSMLKRRKTQYIERSIKRSQYINRNHQMCFETARDYGVKNG